MNAVKTVYAYNVFFEKKITDVSNTSYNNLNQSVI